MRSRKRAAIALLSAALLSLGACDGGGTGEADDPSGEFEQAPGENVPEAEVTDEREDN
ncbi:MAG: hypothetical protein KY391_04730 [Actinobacteria bacterium]|nr:hypothetical protein [Actinomycetota bacterium]